MSNTQTKPWSDNPNAPKIPHPLYTMEKSNFAGVLIASILYGTLVVLFFQCMNAMLDPSTRKRGGIKWGLVYYTMVMFSCATVAIGMAQNLVSIAAIDNREFPGIKGVLYPGPVGYQMLIDSKPLVFAPNLVSLLNYWLADGFLLHRCYVIFARNPWVIAFPCFMYLASMATGIMIIISQARQLDYVTIAISHLSITVPLNLFLTLAIVIRLVLHGRNVRAATGSRAGIGGLYKIIATMLIESSALYSVSSLLFIGMEASRSNAAALFVPIHAQIQVIAPLLIIQRVAKRSALTSDTIVTGNTGSFRARSRQESMGGSHGLTGGYPTCSADNHGRDQRAWDHD